MKILHATDIHYHFSTRGDRLWKEHLTKVADKNEIDVVLLGGDNGSHEPDHELDCFLMVQKIFPKAQIRWVRGNHSMWSSFYRNAQETYQHLILESDRMGVLNISNHPIVLDEQGILLAGFDGWYASCPMMMNDRIRINNFYESDQWLSKHANESFGEAVELCQTYFDKGYGTVLVTHWPFFESVKELDYKSRGGDEYFGAPLAWENFLDPVNTVLYGHTHQEFHSMAKNGTTEIHNPGPDYEKPSTVIIEV